MTNIKLVYTTTNTVKERVQVKQHNSNQYDGSGVYSLNCKVCPLQYKSQTGRSFKTRFKEHKHAIKYNKDTTHNKHGTYIRKYSGRNGCNTSS